MSAEKSSSFLCLAGLNLTKITAFPKCHIAHFTSKDNSTHRALKAFPTDDAESKEIFAREQRIHSALSHPHIIQYISCTSFTLSGCEFSTILMEYAPHGDFFTFTNNFFMTDIKLIRTYFHHLVDGLNYMHSCGIAHLDLKLENLLMTDDFKLKICDFDLAHEVKNRCAISRGTENYRAPELLAASFCPESWEAYQADVYSAGICLFSLLTGAFPFLEEGNGLFRYDLYENENDQFWEENQKIVSGGNQITEDLRSLLNGMWKKDSAERLTLSKIRNSEWFCGPTYSNEELLILMRNAILD